MEPVMPRNDIKPVILGGDWSTYALARQFVEAFGVSSGCIIPEPIAVIKHSRFIEHVPVENMSCDAVVRAIEAVARANADKTVLVIANTDDRVETVERVSDRLPENVLCPVPPHELAARVSDKVSFARICDEYGLDTPRTEIAHIAPDADVPSISIAFPLVVKPAVSAEYAHLYARGFKKVYFIRSQEELDELWESLRGAGFVGDMLAQELIEGDDTFMDSLTLYVDGAGEVTLFAGAHVLLEDHAPTLFGNPVAMITKPQPELWEQAARMLKGIGWRGFANIDVKRDPKTGRKIFMDFNPRMGANSYYVCAAGANPMEILVRDVVDGERGTVRTVENRVLYTRIPVSLARKYVDDKALLAEFDTTVASGAVVNPTRCAHDSCGSRLAGWVMEKNYIRKFARFYPAPTSTSF